MPVDLHVFENEQIVIAHQLPPFDVEIDIPQIRRIIIEFMRRFEGQLNLIVDMNQISIDFSCALLALAKVSQAGDGAINTPGLQTIFVSQSDTVHALCESLKQERYGRADVKTCFTVNEALDLVHYQA